MAVNPVKPTFFSPSLSFSSFLPSGGAGVPVGVNAINDAKSFFTGPGVVLVESPETEVAAVDVPGVEVPVIDGLASAALKPWNPEEDNCVGSAGFGVVEALIGGDEKPNVVVVGSVGFVVDAGLAANHESEAGADGHGEGFEGL